MRTTEREITASRIGRLAQLGQLAGGIAGNMLTQGAKQWVSGGRPSMGELLLTPDNARRLADRLSEMRGAAMKVGQLMSMDTGQLLPPQFGEMLAKLRENAHYMPLGDVATILRRAWGENWDSRFTRFAFTPCAAASIGQVHDACLSDGRRLAIKVQYPGIDRSIDSDVDNVATLLKLFRAIPEEMELRPLLEESKRQLHAEADYLREASLLGFFRDSLAGDDRFEVPEIVDELTTSEVLAMSYLNGKPIETLSERSAEERNAGGTALLALALRELFDWGTVQTDPNFANYLYQHETHRIQLLDFGAVRTYGPDKRNALRQLLAACADGDGADMARAAVAVGYLGEDDNREYIESVIALLRTATEPIRSGSTYRFGTSDLASRMSEKLIEIRLKNRFGRLPPAEVLFLHRKLGGVYLLLAYIQASVPVTELVEPYLD